MTYATLQDLVDRAGEPEILQIADRDEDDVADAGVIADAIDQAGQRIDAALAVRFKLPLSAVPPVVNHWAVSIARYLLHRDGAPDHVTADYKQALSDLEKASAGKLAVPGAEGLEPASGSFGKVSHTASEPAFTRDKLEGFL